MNYNEAKNSMNAKDFENYVDACDSKNNDLVPYYDLYPDDEKTIDDVIKTHDLAKKMYETETGTTKENWKKVYERYDKYLTDYKTYKSFCCDKFL